MVSSEEINDHIREEFYKNLGMERQRWFRLMADPFLNLPLRRFSELAADFEGQVAQYGLQSTAQEFLSSYVDEYHIVGQENIPLGGPVIIVCNHPGALDTLMLPAGIPRLDLKAIVSGVPFFRSLPKTSQHFIFSTLDTHTRMNVVRQSMRHLKDEGTLLIFPGGTVEPDPTLLPGAEEAMEKWFPSLGLLMQKIPAVKLIPAIVSGVLELRYYNHWTARPIRSRLRRQKYAEYLMVMQILRRGKKFELIPLLTFGQPFSLADVAPPQEPNLIMDEVLQREKSLLRDHMELRKSI